jgi:hypothetical protein
MASAASNVASLRFVPVEDIHLDVSNPRIRKFLEHYPDEPTPEQVFLALGAAGDDGDDSSTSFEKLKNSILTNGGIIQPIIVSRQKDGRLVCIEGNTRLALYKNFLRENVKGDWALIPALLYEDMDEARIDAIRLQVHLVGTRPWDPYSKAKYLYRLRTQELLPFSEIVDYCGGRQKEVVELIQAYADMEEYYRPIIPDDGTFDTTRFSGFVELQKPGLKKAVAEAGFTLTNFAEWIYGEKLYPLNMVRWLPRILRNPKARDIFLKDGARAAVQVLEKPDLSNALLEANVSQLAQAITQAIYAMPWPEAEKIRQEPGGQTAQCLNEALIALTALINPSTTGQ